MSYKFSVPYRTEEGKLSYIEVIENSTKNARKSAITELSKSCQGCVVIGGLRQIKNMGLER